MAIREVVAHSLNDVLKNIALYPSYNGDSPEELGWEEFIAKHDHYVQYQFGAAHSLVTGGREIVEDLPLHKQKLGAAIIRAQFRDEEIEKYGREEI